MSDELNALLGINIDETVEQVERAVYPIGESELNTTEKVENELLLQTQDMLNKSNSAVSAILAEVESTSGDPDLLQGAAKMIQAHTALIEQLNKVWQTKEKFKQNLELQKAQIAAASKMNEDNNTTRVMVSRNEMMSKMLQHEGSTVTVTPEVVRSEL